MASECRTAGGVPVSAREQDAADAPAPGHEP